jgi:hypothetical protein
MSRKPWFHIGGGFAVLATVLTICLIAAHKPATAQNNGNGAVSDTSLVQLGYAAAPVPLNTAGQNPSLVGLGSYYVNVVGDCDGCHSAGPPTEYAAGGNPYLNQPKVVNPKTYLGGGRDFGTLGPPSNAASAHIISRNLTPDKTGLPAGLTFTDFATIIRTGVDDDHLHPTCTGALNAGCVPPPFDGDLLQIMPWPNLKNLSARDLAAIYSYLSSIPCVHSSYPGEDPHRCG